MKLQMTEASQLLQGKNSLIVLLFEKSALVSKDKIRKCVAGEDPFMVSAIKVISAGNFFPHSEDANLSIAPTIAGGLDTCMK